MKPIEKERIMIVLSYYLSGRALEEAAIQVLAYLEDCHGLEIKID